MKQELKCSSCGGQLAKIELEEDTYVCLHCGSKEIITDDVTNNNYNVTNNVTNHIYGNVSVDDDKSDNLNVKECIKKTEAYIKIKEYNRAYKMLNGLANDHPEEYMIWWLLSKTCLLARIEYFSKGLAFKFDATKYDEYYEKARLIASPEEIATFAGEYEKLESEANHLLSVHKERLEKAVKKEARSAFTIAFIPILLIILVGLLISLM